MSVATKLGIFTQALGHFKAFVATKMDIFTETLGHFQAVFLPTEMGIFTELSGFLLLCLWQLSWIFLLRRWDIFQQCLWRQSGYL